jgi:hypothetical protein
MKKLTVIINIVFVLFLLWILISFIDVNLHNNAAETAKEIADWNFFKILFG